MAIYGAFTNCGIFVGGYEFTGRSNAVTGTLSAEERDRSFFGDLAKVRGLGPESISLSVAGLLDVSAGQVDEAQRLYLWDDSVPASLFIPATSGAAVVEGDRAFFFKAIQPRFERGGAWGSDLLFKLDLSGGAGGYPPCIGRVLNPGITAVTATGNTTGIQIVGGVPLGQYLYAILHVTSVSASDSIVVTIESAPLANFAAPTTQVTFASFAAIGAFMAVRIPGAITDEFFRAVHTLTGGSISIKYACAIAVRS